MKTILLLAILAAPVVAARAEIYLSAAGGPAWVSWPRLAQQRVTRQEAALGWQFSPRVGGEAGFSTTTRAHSSEKYSIQTLMLFAPGTADLNAVNVIDYRQAWRSSAATVGAVFSFPLGRQFSLVTRQQVAFVTNTRFSDDRVAYGVVSQLPNLPGISRTVRRDRMHHARWQPTAGLFWKPTETSRAVVGLEAVPLDGAEVKLFAVQLRAGVHF
jgi:hypothetical protein